MNSPWRAVGLKEFRFEQHRAARNARTSRDYNIEQYARKRHDSEMVHFHAHGSRSCRPLVTIARLIDCQAVEEALKA